MSRENNCWLLLIVKENLAYKYAVFISR